MYFDFEDYRPETPRVTSAISFREGVLLSLVFHLLALLFIVLAPSSWFEPADEIVPAEQQQEPLRFVQVMPSIDRNELAKRLTELADLDRSKVEPPAPQNMERFSRGDTPEHVEGAPAVPAAGPVNPEPPAPAPAPPPALSDTAANVLPEPPRQARPARGNLGQALRNLERYLQDQNFENPEGGKALPDFQFDDKGVDFGPWLRRFRNQIQRNWIIPQVAELAKGRVVITFAVLRNGSIIGLNVAQPAGIEALTSSALTALKLSNPTAALPPEYPDDRVQFTVTFHYNEGYRDSPQ